MIINFNITGKETMEQIAQMATDATMEFQADIPKDGRGAKLALILYSMFANQLQTLYIVNEAMNEQFNSKTDPYVSGLENVKNLSLHLENSVKTTLNQVMQGQHEIRNL